MKKVLKAAFALSCAALGALSMTACNEGKASQLKAPKEATTLTYSERSENSYGAIRESAEIFAAEFAPRVYSKYSNSDNFAVSPMSVYMALTLAAQCSAGDTRSEILSALGISYENLAAQFSDYYRSVFAKYTTSSFFGSEIKIGEISLTNSIWLDEQFTPKQDCIDALSDKFFCYSYSTDFAGDNKGANKAIKNFVSDKTNGIIDREFDFDTETVFTLINTLYLKDVWNADGDELNFTDGKYEFVENGGNVKNTRLLQGYYNRGRAVDFGSFTTFFTETDNGNRIKFILPNEGYGVKDVFTAENISRVGAITSYNAIDDDKKEIYHTRCLFPEYKASYDEDVSSVLKDMGVNSLFSRDNCDFTTLTDDKAYCNKVIHAAELKVDRIGIVGAAVTAMGMCGAAGPGEYTDVYYDFIVDKAFAFIITDRYDNTLFSGVVNHI